MGFIPHKYPEKKKRWVEGRHCYLNSQTLEDVPRGQSRISTRGSKRLGIPDCGILKVITREQGVTRHPRNWRFGSIHREFAVSSTRLGARTPPNLFMVHGQWSKIVEDYIWHWTGKKTKTQTRSDWLGKKLLWQNKKKNTTSYYETGRSMIFVFLIAALSFGILQKRV